MEHEEEYGRKLLILPDLHAPNKNGFDKDDGASLKNAFKGVTFEMSNEGRVHLKIALNIKELVVDPFSKWSQEHKQRVQYSEKILKSSLNVYKNKFKTVEKVQKKYFNKCRIFETLKQGLSEDEILKELNINDPVENTQHDNEDSSVILGGIEYNTSDLRDLFVKMLSKIPQISIKVPIIGVYDNCSTGSDIVLFLQENLKLLKIDECEQFGNDLIAKGYLKKINTLVGFGPNINTLVNSSSFSYQWRDVAFEIANLNKEKIGNSIKRINNNEPIISTTASMTKYLGDLKSSFEEPTLKKINREIMELDESYQLEVGKLDKVKCDLEELIIDHLTFMEKCELDRLKALKKVTLDFSASISNDIFAIKNSIDKILVYEESIHPDKDLYFFLQNYRTGSFSPKVILYDNYYDSFKDQIFGVDLEFRCKNDQKTVPLIVSSILSYMDKIYPDLPNDEVRTKIWLVPVKLQSTHQLRREIETKKNFNDELLSSYAPEVVASVLKLYLLELPDSLVPNQVYDLIKSIYNQFGSDDDEKSRINGITNVFKELNRPNIATLNALSTHFQRLISILKEGNKDNETIWKSFQNGISQELSNCIIRPRNSNNVNINDRFTFRFLNDLLNNKTEIFKELRNNLNNSNNNGLLSRHQSQLKRRDSSLQTKLQQAVKQGSRKASQNSINEKTTS